MEDNATTSVSLAIPSQSLFEGFPIEIMATEDRGRIMIAKRDLLAGELVMRSLAYTTTVSDDFRWKVCSSCLENVTTGDDQQKMLPFICEQCREVGFCSRACLKNSDHSALECKTLKHLRTGVDDQFTTDEFSEMRILIRALCQKVREDQVAEGSMERDLMRREECVSPSSSLSPPDKSSSASDSEGEKDFDVYSRDECRSVRSSDEEMGVSDMRRGTREESSDNEEWEFASTTDACMSHPVFGLSFLRRPRFEDFARLVGQKELVPIELQSQVRDTRRMARHVLSIFSGTAWDGPLDEGTLADLFLKERCNVFGLWDSCDCFASSIFPSASFFNHSCVSNCAKLVDDAERLQITWPGRILSVRTVVPVRAGDELTISYVNPKHHRKLRQNELFGEYFFLCRCPRCLSPGRTVDTVHNVPVNSAIDHRECLASALMITTTNASAPIASSTSMDELYTKVMKDKEEDDDEKEKEKEKEDHYAYHDLPTDGNEETPRDSSLDSHSECELWEKRIANVLCPRDGCSGFLVPLNPTCYLAEASRAGSTWKTEAHVGTFASIFGVSQHHFSSSSSSTYHRRQKYPQFQLLEEISKQFENQRKQQLSSPISSCILKRKCRDCSYEDEKNLAELLFPSS